MTQLPVTELDGLADAIRGKVANGTRRYLIGLAGAPGSGKSTAAAQLGEVLGGELAVVVPMDGFHLAQNLIEGTPLQDRRGAPDTFDVGGYLNLLRRLRANEEPVIYAPSFRRPLEDPIAAAIAIPQDVPVVITEGNYLLLDRSGWGEIRALLDETWYVIVPDEIRVSRLVQRHIGSGKSGADATAWVNGPDAANTLLIESTRDNADGVLEWS
jgi:pantothenate kinase